MLDLVVRLVYKAEKTTLLGAMNKEQLALSLEQDLELLNFPKPSEDDIRKPNDHGVSFSWSTSRFSTLYDVVTGLVDTQDESEGIKEAKRLCSIERVYVTAIPQDSTPLLPSNGARKYRRLSIGRRSECGLEKKPQKEFRPQDISGYKSRQNMDEKLKTQISLKFKKPKLKPTPAQQFKIYFPHAVHVPTTQISAPTVIVTNKFATPEAPDELSALLREYWDVRRQLTASCARGTSLESQLGVIHSQLNIHNDMFEHLARAEAELEHERTRREAAEQILEDVQRECTRPSVVPALLQIFGLQDIIV